MPSRQQRLQRELLPHVDAGGEERSAGVTAIVCEIVSVSAECRVLGISIFIRHYVVKRFMLDHLVAYTRRKLSHLFPDVSEERVRAPPSLQHDGVCPDAV